MHRLQCQLFEFKNWCEELWDWNQIILLMKFKNGYKIISYDWNLYMLMVLKLFKRFYTYCLLLIHSYSATSFKSRIFLLSISECFVIIFLSTGSTGSTILLFKPVALYILIFCCFFPFRDIHWSTNIRMGCDCTSYKYNYIIDHSHSHIIYNLSKTCIK